MHYQNNLSGSVREGRRIGFGGYGEVYEAQLVSANGVEVLVSRATAFSSGRLVLINAGCRQSDSFPGLYERHL